MEKKKNQAKNTHTKFKPKQNSATRKFCDKATTVVAVVMVADAGNL